jgi:hypothetical protein
MVSIGSRIRHPELRLPSLGSVAGKVALQVEKCVGQNQPGIGDIPVDLFDQFGDAGELLSHLSIAAQS